MDNQIFSKFDQILGKTTPTAPAGGVQSRASQLMSQAPESSKLPGSVPSNLPSSLNPVSTQPTQEDPNMLYIGGKPVVGGLVGGILKPVVNFGQSIGAGSQAPKNAELFAKNQSQHDEIANNLSKAIATKQSSGQDTTRLQAALDAHNADAPKLEDFTGDVINKTTEQVIGEGVGTGLAVLSGGGLSAGKEALGAELAGKATLGQTLKTGAKIGASYGGVGGVGSAMEQNKSAGDVAKEGATGAITGAIVGAGTAGALHGATKLPSAISKLAESKGGEASKVAVPDIQATIDALNPNLSGKKLVSGYKQVATGQRGAVEPSIFREQGLTPDQQTIKLGTRLQDLNLGKNHIENLNKLGTGLEQTETKLGTALKGDPEVNFNADKPTLFENLNAIKTDMPREFSAIKDSKSVFNNVVDFAKDITNKAEDSISGIRDARTKFDAQAQREYPSAYKEGRIDTSTPAGRAIKTVRDAMNEHLYNTAPNGSEIQQLIGREADIFRAVDNIAPKAAKGQGKNVIAQFIKDHPTAAKIAGYGVVGTLGVKAGHILGI